MAPLGRISWMGQVDAVLASVSDMLYSWGLMWPVSYTHLTLPTTPYV